MLRSECVFNSALAENQNYRRISKQAAGAPLGTTVDNFHTAPSGKIVQVRNPFEACLLPCLVALDLRRD